MLKILEYILKRHLLGVNSYITIFSAAMEYGGEEHRLPNITYWENVLEYRKEST